MYKRTIWQDDVAGIQKGTDMNAANFNNLEAGTMEANALAALNTAYQRYAADVAKNNEAVIVSCINHPIIKSATVNIPANATRNHTNYNVVPVIEGAVDGTVGDLFITSKQANGFAVSYTGTAASVAMSFIITGGMI